MIPMTSDQKLKIAGLAVAMAVPVVGSLEGLRQYVYRDPVGIPTYCFGETKSPEWGKRYSLAECNALLAGRVDQAVGDVQRCTTAALEPHQLAALASFAYNVGAGAYCKSTLAKRAQRGDFPGACAELDKWTYARGVQLPGLVKRRALERAMCEGRT